MGPLTASVALRTQLWLFAHGLLHEPLVVSTDFSLRRPHRRNEKYFLFILLPRWRRVL